MASHETKNKGLKKERGGGDMAVKEAKWFEVHNLIRKLGSDDIVWRHVKLFSLHPAEAGEIRLDVIIKS